MSAAAAHLPHKPISRTLTTPPTLPNFGTPPTLRRSPLRRTAVFVSAKSVHSQLRLDAVLEVAEILCIAPPAIFSIGCLVRVFQVNVQSRVFAAQCVLVVVAVAIGGVIRRRQWERVFTTDGVDLAARIERVEGEVRSSGAVVRALSRQLEKLGIRFRVTRRALKEPIAEIAALSQKNSEATRVLAIQEGILEKELGEIQKVLLAMQEQQQKQLELILAIGKAGKLFDTKQDSVTGKTRNGTGNLVPKKEVVKPLEVRKERHTGANDRV